MPYGKVSELPDSVKNNLPKHAQEIYKEPSTQPKSNTGRRAAPTG
jgi:cation transport regulator ChaB